MHVRVNADAILIEPSRQHQVRGLSPHALEREQTFNRARDPSIMFFEQRPGDYPDRSCLDAVEPDGIDGLLYGLVRKFCQELGSGCELEQTFGSRTGRAVMRPEAKDAGDQYLEGITVMGGQVLEPGQLQRLDLFSEEQPDMDKVFKSHKLNLTAKP